MGDFNVDLTQVGTHGPTSDFLEVFTAGSFYPLISLPTRLTDDRDDGRPGTATLIDNIWTGDVESKVVSGLVTVRISDHLPVFAFVGGAVEVEEEREQGVKRRLVNERRIGKFAEELEGWSYDERGAGGGGERGKVPERVPGHV